MKQDFLDYIQNEFDFSDSEISDFAGSLNTPLKKSIRINTNKISVTDFEQLALKNNWTLTPTSLGSNMFYIDRDDTSIPLGHTPEHMAGYFYVQELAASSSPYYMSWDTIDIKPYLILDMSASPGGKTTQLCEYYPNSLIVANELDKSRLKGLFSNLDRIGALGSIVTNYDGRFFKQIPEIFDKVLLDAPCSWEWTGYKTDDALKYWNIKNIKRVAKLQFWLLEAAIKASKPGGEIIYSTCTLNTIENEQILEKALKKYSDYIQITPLLNKEGLGVVRAWPHINKTGGFFVAKLTKTQSIEQEQTPKQVNQNLEKISNKETKIIENFFQSRFAYDISHYHLYRYHGDIMMCNKNIEQMWDILFLYKVWVQIWDFKDGNFYPSFFAGTQEIFADHTLTLWEKDLDMLLKGYEISSGHEDGYYQIISPNHLPIGLAKLQNQSLKSLLPSNMMRK